jgi:hypothetical protein
MAATAHRGITLMAILDKVIELSKESEYLKCYLSQSIFGAMKAILYQALGDADNAAISAQISDSRRIAAQSHIGSRSLQIAEDIALDGKAPEKQDPHPAEANYKPYQKVFNRNGTSYTSVATHCTFMSLDKLLPDVAYVPQGHLFGAYTKRTQQQLAHDWLYASDGILTATYTRISAMNHLFATQFSNMVHVNGALFPFLRAVVHSITDGDFRFRYSALDEFMATLQRVTSVQTFHQNRPAIEQQARQLGTITFSAPTYAVHHLIATLGSEIPALQNMAPSSPCLPSTIFQIQAYGAAVETSAHASIVASSPDVPEGCYKDNKGLHCKGCHKPVQDPVKHNANNCRSKAANATSQAKKGSKQHGKQRAQQSQQQQQPKSHAHFTAEASQSPAQSASPTTMQLPPHAGVQPAYYPAMFQYPPYMAPSAAGSAPPYPPPGQSFFLQPGYGCAHAASYVPSDTGTQILDCGASITTVGSSIQLFNSFPINMTLRMTRGSTSRVRQGLCILQFPDVHGKPVSLRLKAITSPDIQADILLVSYHQLLLERYRIYLDVTYGKVYTPSNECILLTVKNGVWHFPSLANHPPCQLHIDSALSHMVIGRGKAGWHAEHPAGIAPAQPPSVLPQPAPPCVDQEQHISAHADDTVSPGLSLSDSRASALESETQGHSSEEICLQDTRPAPAPLVPPAAAPPVYLSSSRPHEHDSTGHVAAPSSHAPVVTMSSSSSDPGPSADLPSPSTVRSSQPKKSKPRTGSALSIVEAHKICQTYHDANDHCGGKTWLKNFLYKTIPDQAHRPSSAHIQSFVCGPCALAKSKIPPQRKTHPPTVSEDGFQPGESLFVDGSGAYNFPTEDGSTQHFIVVDQASHAKFVFPTADKSCASLITVLRDLQSNWRVKIRKIRTDQEFARAHEFRTWTSTNDIALEETPPYVHQGNGKAERSHGLIQDLARTQKIQAGASNLLWSYACRYSAKQLNHVPTKADASNRSPLTICPSLPFQHTHLKNPPWGCEMFAHIGQDTSTSTAAAARARRGVFVGIADNGPSYLLYDMDKQKVYKACYAQFNEHQFPLKQRLLAGQALPPDGVVDPDCVLRLAPSSPDDVSDAQLAEYASFSKLLLDVPPHFFPEYAHGWRLQCSRPFKKKDKVSVVTIFDQYHGPESRLPKDMRNYRTHPKDTVFQVSPPAKGKDYSLRAALRITYPNCQTLGEMAAASVRSRGAYPSHPAVALANVAFSQESVFHAYQQDASKPTHIHQLHAYAARTAYAARVMTGGVRIRPISLPPLNISAGSIGFQPTSRKSAMRHPSWPLWKKAEDDECAGIRKRGVIQPVLRSAVPAGAQILHHHFVYTDKASGPKVRVCVRGDEQVPYPSDSETYASTPGAPLVRVVFSYAAQHGHQLHKMDVSQAFTQAEPFPPDVHIYMYPPPGQEQEGYVWRLLRPLYGLAVAPACWSATLRTYLASDGWTPVVEGEDTLYKRAVTTSSSGTHNMFLIFHVDDILVSAHPSCDAAVADFKSRFLTRFQGKDEGLVSKYIGIDVHRVQDRIYLTQSSLIQELVDYMGLTDSNATLTPLESGTRLLEADRPKVNDPVRTKHYQHIVGCLQYLTHWTRPDLAHATHELSKHQSNPGEKHLDAAKRTVRYLKGTVNYGLVYRHVHSNPDRLIGFADADWAGDIDTRRSLSANVFMCNGGAVLWHCKQQQGVATSTSEAEFVSASTAGKDAEWFRRVLHGMGMHQPGPTPIYEDNKGCRLMSENPVQKSKTRHIDVAQHKVSLLAQQNVVRLIDCPTNDMAADLLTKALAPPSFHRHRDTILGYTPSTAPPLPSSFHPWRGY